MRIRTTTFTVVLIVLSFVAFAFAADSGKRLITEKDLWLFHWIADPRVSPEGSQVVYAEVTVDKKRTGYETSLWIVPTQGDAAPRRLTTGTHDSQPRWSPDGSMLVFARSVEKDGKPQPPQLYLLSMSGGEPTQLTDLPKGAGGPQWSPDGKRIAFSSDTAPEDIAKKRKEKSNGEKKTAPSAPTTAPGQESEVQPPAKAESKSDQGEPTPESASVQPTGKQMETANEADEEEHESDVHYVTRAVYRANGQGYLDFDHPSHIWVIDLSTNNEKAEPKQLTSGKYDENEFFWSKDGNEIIYTTVRVDEPYYDLPHTDIYSVPAAGGEPRLINAVKIGVNGMSPSPDGKRIAFFSSENQPVRSYDQPDLYVLELTSGAQPKNLTADFDYDAGDGVGGDNAPPRANAGSLSVWSADGKRILDTAAITGRANLMWYSVDGGKPSPLTKGDRAVQAFTATPDGKTLVARISTPTMIGDLFIIDPVSGTQRRLTGINAKLWGQLDLTEPEEIWYPSFDGKKIQAWVQKPPQFDPGKKYPLIINIHGGPHSAYGWVFDHEFQWMAARGYVVLYVNPRGSTSYGQDFGNIIQYKYPGDDYKDLMAGVDELIKRGYIDENKLGVTGGSGGGVLTDWTVTQTDRFKAAVSQRDISDWAGWWYSDDFWLFHPRWFRKAPFQDPKEYADRSAITFVDKVHTPIAFILGDADIRTPPEAGGEQMFRALKFMKRPTAMVRFPNETHELSRSGQPWHRIERLEAIVGWFDKYLLGQDVKAYRDVTGAFEVPAPAAKAKTVKKSSAKPPAKPAQ